MHPQVLSETAAATADGRTLPEEIAGPDPSHLADAVRRLSRTSVLVVGDAMLDTYIYGEVERVSPEAPVPVLCVDREVAVAGGAGNVVRNLGALGAAVAFVSVVGDDQAGSDLTGLVGGQPGVEPWLLVQGGRATTRKTRFIARGQQLLRADAEDVSPIHPKLAERLLRIARDAMAATSVTILSDYRKGVLAGAVPAQLIAEAKGMGRRIVADLRGTDFAAYAGADVVMPGRRDLAAATGMPTDTDAQVALAAARVRDAHGFGAVLVRRAEDGMSLVSEDGVRHFRAEAAEVFDVSGAGDTAVATLAAGLAGGLDLPVAAQLASIAAAVVLGRVGTAVVRPADLATAISPQGGALRKICTRDLATERVERWRRLGWRMAFVAGGFDPLLPSQMRVLEQAREASDRVVVALESDASLRNPAQPEAVRAARVASLPCVDLVVVQDDETPQELLQSLRPDVLAVLAEPVPLETSDLLRSWGGKVLEQAAG